MNNSELRPPAALHTADPPCPDGAGASFLDRCLSQQNGSGAKISGLPSIVVYHAAVHSSCACAGLGNAHLFQNLLRGEPRQSPSIASTVCVTHVPSAGCVWHVISIASLNARGFTEGDRSDGITRSTPLLACEDHRPI